MATILPMTFMRHFLLFDSNFIVSSHQLKICLHWNNDDPFQRMHVFFNGLRCVKEKFRQLATGWSVVTVGTEACFNDSRRSIH